jgi:hypothetical protein
MAATQVAKLRRQSLEPSEETHARQSRAFWGCVLLLLLAFVVGVRFAAQRLSLTNQAVARSDGLYYSLSMKKKIYRPGERIEIQLLVSNVSSESIKLHFENSVEYDILIQKDEDILIAKVPQTVWQFSRNSGVINVFKPHTIEILAGQTHKFTAVWPQKDYANNEVSPGRYDIVGTLLAKDRNEQLKLRGSTK